MIVAEWVLWPTLLAHGACTCAHDLRMCCEFSRWKDAEYPDIGPLEGPIPEQVDCVIVGAGIAGKRLSDAHVCAW